MSMERRVVDKMLEKIEIEFAIDFVIEIDFEIHFAIDFVIEIDFAIEIVFAINFEIYLYLGDF